MGLDWNIVRPIAPLRAKRNGLAKFDRNQSNPSIARPAGNGSFAIDHRLDVDCPPPKTPLGYCLSGRWFCSRHFLLCQPGSLPHPADSGSLQPISTQLGLEPADLVNPLRCNFCVFHQASHQLGNRLGFLPDFAGWCTGASPLLWKHRRLPCGSAACANLRLSRFAFTGAVYCATSGYPATPGNGRDATSATAVQTSAREPARGFLLVASGGYPGN